MTTPLDMTPGLGMLTRLSQELRDMIYEFTFCPPDQQVDAQSACKPRSILVLVSMVLHDEITQLVERPQGWPCLHTHFAFWEPLCDERRSYKYGAPTPFSSKSAQHHNLDDAQLFRIILLSERTDDEPAPAVKLTFRTNKSKPKGTMENDFIAYPKTASYSRAFNDMMVQRFTDDFPDLTTKTRGKLLEELMIDMIYEAEDDDSDR
ncbi:hypothetical protein LTR85_006596 [Meristemomyces frigidus]|nr:hypothetical protein LTR85_006596 [Meristemomyces frigidus]